MRHTSNITDINTILINRLAMEQNLAHALVGEFTTGQLHRDVMAAVNRMLEYIVGLLRGPAAPIVLQQQTNNAFLLGLSQNGGSVLTAYERLQREGTLPIIHCADLIRFFGEVVDAAAKAPGAHQSFIADRAQQIGWRYGGGGEYWKAMNKSGYVAQADRGSVWQKQIQDRSTESNSVRSSYQGGRIRIKPTTPGMVSPFLNGPNPFYDIVPGATFNSEALQGVNVRTGTGAGATQWFLTEKSTIKKIDLVFGLPFAADISGTTTDTMHFLQKFGNVTGDPLILMLPLATIVSSYHHSLIEVAAAMSLKNVIKYKITFYSTLLTDCPAGRPPHVGRAGIASVLQRFENSADNQHALIYYSGASRIGGAFIMEVPEIEKFKEIATCDIRLWPKFNSFASYPTEDNIMSLLADVGLRDAALASRRTGLRKTEHRLW